MKVVLVNPPLSHRYVHSVDEPLGLLYLAAAIIDRHEVYIVDALNNQLTSGETADLILELGADVVGVSLVFTGAYQTSLDILEKIKVAQPGIISILGGNTATFCTGALVRNPQVDYVLRGEGDISFPQILEALASGVSKPDVPGISYRNKDKVDLVVHNPETKLVQDLDQLPFPARERLPLRNKYPYSILSSRGCAYGCIYCSSAAFWQKTFRMRGIDNIIEEIKAISREDELKHFSFADDCLTLLPQRARELARRIGGLNLDCTWGCTGRIETISEDLLRDLSRAGCKGMFFGVESGSAKVLKQLGRRYTPDEVYQTYSLCAKYGIRPYFSFMVGLPFETKEDLVLTYQLIQRLEGVENGVHILTPLPGTPILINAEKYGLKISGHGTDELDINSYSVAATEHFTQDEINEAYRKAVGYSIKGLRRTEVLSRLKKDSEVC